MKYVLPAFLPVLVAVVCTLTACETTADRRDLYAPDKPQGPYYDMLHHRTLTVAESAPTPPEEGLPPIAPPPPAAGAMDMDAAGAPEATPVPMAPSPLPAPAPGPMTPSAPPASAPPPAATPAPDSGGGQTPLIPGLNQ